MTPDSFILEVLSLLDRGLFNTFSPLMWLKVVRSSLLFSAILNVEAEGEDIIRKLSCPNTSALALFCAQAVL